jgi:oligopeptidase B
MALYDEMTGRLPSEHTSVTTAVGEYLYYTRTLRRRDLPLFCRRLPDGPEQVVLDLQALADAHGYAGLGAMSVSPDNALLAFTLDLTGAEDWELRVIEAATGRLVSRRGGVLSVEWAAGDQLAYTELDRRGRPARALLHTAGSGSSSADDRLLLEEPDEAAVVDVSITKGRRWLTLNSNTRQSSEVHLLGTDEGSLTEGAPRLVAPREPGVTYFVDELSDGWLLLVANPEPPSRALGLSTLHESELPAARARWRALRSPQPEGEPIEDVDVFASHVVLYERAEDGVPRARVLRVVAEGGRGGAGGYDGGHGGTGSADASRSRRVAGASSTPTHHPPPALLEDGFVPLPTNGGPAALSAAPNRRFGSSTLHFDLSSPAAPPASYAYDMQRRILSVRAQSTESPARVELTCERRYARARDGEQLPLTLVRTAGRPLTEQTPLHLVCYGAYGASLAAEWRAEHLPLLERGWLVVLAHVRGGGELGPRWHRAGAGLRKPTSAHDVCDVLRDLHSRGVSSPAFSTAAADSAGALALGGAINEEPGLLAAALLRAPFLDPLRTMLDPSLPLVVEEREEWGDPAACEATRAAMELYSPHDALRWGAAYPAMMLVAAENDARVPLTQSLDYLARLRERSQDAHSAAAAGAPPQMLHLRESGGHQGEGGRYRRFEQASVELAFLMRAAGGTDLT